MMRTLLLPLALLLPGAALAQKVPDRLPPANPIPYESSQEAAVLAPVNALFAALAVGDADAVRRVTIAEGRVTAVTTKPDGSKAVQTESFADFANRTSPDRAFVERIWNAAIETDDDIAMVWAPFDVSIQGRKVSCGTNHLSLIRQDGGWKILNATYTSRSNGCGRP